MAAKNAAKGAPRKRAANKGRANENVRVAKARALTVPVEASDEFRRLAEGSVTANDTDLVEKESLIGIPLVITGWDWRESEFDADRGFVSVECKTIDGQECVFNDGGVGITGQLRAAEDATGNPKHDKGGVTIFCRRGLRVSEYEGPKGPARTFYLN